MKRTLAIGDVHGCLEELRELLQVVRYRPGVDRLVFVGDLVDRGPDPVGVVRHVRALASAGDVLTMMGNHEEKLVRWFRRVEESRTLGRPNKMTPPPPARLAEWEGLGPDDIAWLASRPVFAEPAPGWFVVHAGFEAVPHEEQRSQKMMRCRWLDPETGLMMSLRPGEHSVEGGVWWAERWRGPGHVVYGHAVHSLDAPRVDRPVSGVECWGIDTGCCFGGRLTALVLESREIFQVAARARYADATASDVE